MDNKKNVRFSGMGIYMIIVIIAAMFIMYVARMNTGTSNYTYNELVNDISKGKIESVSIRQNAEVPTGVVTVKVSGEYDYAMSILKSHNGNPNQCDRFTFTYDAPIAGEGHFIHTYMNDGSPLPSFEGEPVLVRIEGNIDTFTNMVWENLNEDNKVSLFVRFIDIKTGEYETRIINKNK